MDAALTNRVETILLGDSHMQSLRDAALASDVGNLAFGADGITEMYAKALIMEHANSNLKRVLISMEPQMFNKSKSPNGGFLNKYMFDNPEVRVLYNRSILDLVVDWVPLFNNSYIEFLRNQALYAFRGMFSADNNGRSWENLTDAEKTNIAIGAGKNDHGNLFEIPGDTIQYRKLVELLQKNKVDTFGVNFPVTHSYFSQLQPEDLKHTRDFITSLSLNMEADYTLLFDNLDAFKDPDHLTAEYVKKFADRLEADLEVSLVR